MSYIQQFYRFLLILSFLTGFIKSSYTQFYNTGSAPASVDWKILKNKSFNLIFPSENEKASIRFSTYLSNTLEQNGYWFDSAKPKPINIIMYNQNVLSNAYVTLAPRRMEIISTPRQDGYAHDWLEQLALHEYRHVIQLHTLKQGFTKKLSWITGDIAHGAMVAFLPLWFIEGDAVIAETALSSSGRGREPDFVKGIKAIELQCPKRYTYDQAYLGSYKGFVPDYYSYGYQMMSWTNLNYGNHVTKNIIKNVAKRPYTLAPFYFGLKNETGLSKVEVYNSTFNYLSEKWNSERNSQTLIPETIKFTTEFKSNFSSYKFLFIDSNDAIIALRTSIDDIAKFVKIKDGHEEIITKVGEFVGSQVGYSNKYIAWEELDFNYRWEQINYSNIRIFDRSKGNSFILQKKSRHFNPSLSKNEKQIAVIHNTKDYNSIIEIYDLESKERLKSFIHPDSCQLNYNSWINDSIIAVVAIEKSGKNIYSLDIQNGVWTKLFGPAYYNISGLSANSTKILFTYTLDGSQNIYQLDLANNKTHKLTNSEIAADYGILHKNGKRLIFSDYSHIGYKINSIEISDNKVDLSQIKPYSHEFADSLSKIVHFNAQDSTFSETQFTIEKYSKFNNTINLHSWLLPFYVDVLNLESMKNPGDMVDNTSLGFNLFSQNMLSTLTSSIGYYYKDGYSHIRPILKYSGLLPVITFDLDYGGASQYIIVPDTTFNSHPKRTPDLMAGLDIQLPINFSTSRKTCYLITGIDFSYQNTTFVSNVKRSNLPIKDSINGWYYYKNFGRADLYLNAYIASRKSVKDIYPKWGANIYLSSMKSLNTTPFTEFWESDLGIANVYLPGLLRHHSLKVSASSEKGLASRLSLPKGYSSKSNINYNLIYKSQKLSAEYTMPLIYPDISVGPLLYIKRVHASLFYDYMRFEGGRNENGRLLKKIDKIKSTGFEIGFESHLLRFFWPITPIFRFSYLLNDKKMVPGFYLNANYIF